MLLGLVFGIIATFVVINIVSPQKSGVVVSESNYQTMNFDGSMSDEPIRCPDYQHVQRETLYRFFCVENAQYQLNTVLP